jgi:ATP-binding cassette subfamily G (WHITE) protein 2 (SNQ2)
MWATSLPDDRRRRERRENQWHTEPQTTIMTDTGETTAIPSRASESENDGTWGERDTGIESRRMAMADYEMLRKDLTALSRTRSQRERDQAESNSLFRTLTGTSAKLTKSNRSDMRNTTNEVWDLEKEGGMENRDDEDDFELEQFMKDGHFEKRVNNRSAKKVGVVWKNLTVKGAGSTASFVRTLPDAVIGTFGPDLYHIITGFIPQLRLGGNKQTRTLIHDFSGMLRDGEMMLVLGRPGSGCSTFLKTIANQRKEYANVTGEVSYGGISSEKQDKMFRGEVNYNPEDDQHFASLNVWQTLKFALMNKTKKREKDEVPIIINALLKIFGITHTKYTLVGDEYTRGVSGGERKRVSIAETLATKSTVVCWDNSTRGLDSSTALDYAKSLRVMTDISNRTTIVTLYQAGEGIYEVMDKVLLIDEGRCVFEGPAREAKQYFLDLGYYCPERQTTPDFLTSVTDPNERRFRDDFDRKSIPKGPEALEAAFRASDHYKRIQQHLAEYEEELKGNDFADAREFEQTTKEQKSNKTVGKKSPYTVSFIRQVYACVLREFWLLWGDKTTLYTKAFIIISNGLIVGSLFYGESLDTSGAFSRGGALFFSILFLGWLQLAELMKAVSGRVVVARHKEYAFYRPSAVSIARVVVDFPVILAQVIPFVS